MEPPRLPPKTIISPIPGTFPSTGEIFAPLPISQVVNSPTTQLKGNRLGVKIPTIKFGQMLPLETDFKTLNDIRTSRHKIERVNSGATFQPYNKYLTVGQGGLILTPKPGPSSSQTAALGKINLPPAVLEKLRIKFRALKRCQPRFIGGNFQIWNINKTKCQLCIDLVKYGINGRQIIIEVAENDWQKHDDIAYHFTGDILRKSRRWDQPSQEEYLIKNRGKVDQLMKSKRISQEDALFELVKAPGNFRPTLVLAILRYFFPNQTNISLHDPFAGWGDRLVGAMASNVVSTYLGFDLNPNLFQRYNEIYNTFKGESILTNFAILNQAYEKVNLVAINYANKFDLILTSPPFFWLELYYGVDFKYQSVEQWKIGFLYPAANNFATALRDNGILVINLSSIDINGPIDLITPLMEAINQTKSFTYLGLIAFAKPFSVKRPGQKTGWSSPQPLWIWRRNLRPLLKQT